MNVRLSNNLDARFQLSTHRLDATTGTCADCHEPAPCPMANEAAELLSRQGALLVELDTGASRRGWVGWLRRAFAGAR